MVRDAAVSAAVMTGSARAPRSLGQGHIRLLVLSLIEAEPRHGYDLIKQIEEMSGGAYAPSPVLSIRR